MAVGKKSSPTKKSSPSKIKPSKKGLQPYPTDLEYEFAPPKQTICEKCTDCCCPGTPPSEISETELKDLLRQGAGRPSISESVQSPGKKYLTAKDGCSESGYFLPRSIAKPPRFTLTELRKHNKVTHHLPSPETAIINSNFRRDITSHRKAKVKEDRNVTDINNMLRHRLSGTISLDQPGGPDAKDEALLRCKVTGKDYTPDVLSHLVEQSEVAKVLSTNTDSRRSTFYRASTSSRSSFSRKSMNLQVVDSNRRTSIRVPLDTSNDKEFIKYLPQASVLVRKELEADWPVTVSYVRTLEKYCKSHSFDPRSRKTTERWMVIFYTTSGTSDDLTDFRCLLARLLLQHHYVAYEERDIALKKMPYKAQLEERLDGAELTLPYVVARGVNIGSCQIIYALHKLDLMKVIFANYVMSSDTYAQWLYTREKKAPLGLTLNVKLSKFPALRSLVFAKSAVILTTEDTKQVKTGKMVTEKARQHWLTISKENFTEPNLLLFILLKTTIINSFGIMNDIYLKYLVKQKGKEERSCCGLRSCCCCCC